MIAQPKRDGSIRLLSGDQVWGTVVDDTLVKHVNPDLHMLQKPPGYALQNEVLDFCRAKCPPWDRAIQWVVIEEVREGKPVRLLRAPLVAFELYGVSLARGFGPQTALPLDRWTLLDVDTQTPVRQVGEQTALL